MRHRSWRERTTAYRKVARHIPSGDALWWRALCHRLIADLETAASMMAVFEISLEDALRREEEQMGGDPRARHEVRMMDCSDEEEEMGDLAATLVSKIRRKRRQ